MNRIKSISTIETLGTGENFEGYEVITEQDTYLILVDNFLQCCEDFGYFDTNDDSNEFIGAELIEVVVSDTALSQQVLDTSYLEVDDCMFIDFVTDRGVFQLAVYNSHNGFYGHTVQFIKNGDILIYDVR